MCTKRGNTLRASAIEAAPSGPISLSSRSIVVTELLACSEQHHKSEMSIRKGGYRSNIAPRRCKGAQDSPNLSNARAATHHTNLERIGNFDCTIISKSLAGQVECLGCVDMFFVLAFEPY